ncbi:hypothetical protein N0V86_009562 [Didymella sp. IMI 355093]|nr:hypothetical protein N0V86_009562 [Didymella sp. IMI 355093]
MLGGACHVEQAAARKWRSGDLDKALRKRDRRVRRKIREKKGFDKLLDKDGTQSSDENEQDAGGDSSVPEPPLGFTPQNELFKSNLAEGGYYEEVSYDPRVLTKKDIVWLDQCRTLGFNPDTQKAYITGLGSYAGWGDFETSETGADPNDPRPQLYPCYISEGGELNDPTFPFHEACYAVLAKRLGLENPADISKDVLYKVAHVLCEGNAESLTLDYGGQFSNDLWPNPPGEEYAVTCPEDRGPDFHNVIWEHMPSSLRLAEPQPDFPHKVQRDPLTIFPFDVLHTILQNLSVQDALNFMQASHHVCSTTRDPAFWRSMIRTHLAPWFWEIENLVNSGELRSVNFKALLLWLDGVVRPELGMQGPFMGVANRRRVWRVCGQVADKYETQLGKEQEIKA